MLKNVFKGALLIATVVLLTPGTATAQWWQGQSLCANSNLSVCASVTVTWTVSTQLTVTVLNTGSAGTIFTLGLHNNPAWAGTYSLASATSSTRGNVLGYWDEGTQGLNGVIEWGVNRTGAASHGVQVGEQVVFVINFSPGFVVGSNTVLAWHSGQLRVSEKCITGATGEHACSVVPEPISMVLLGTGLAGVGGMGAIRRKRKGFDVENA